MRTDTTGPDDAVRRGVEELPDTDDALAALYGWPDEHDLPRVRGNMITSLDGGAALHGRSGGLGNEADRHLFALLRDLADVILVGSGTVLAEQYAGIRLDRRRRDRRRRWTRPAAPPPIAVVTARGLDPELPLFTDTLTAPIVITTRRAADLVPGTADRILAGEDTIDLGVAVAALAERGHRRIHCEGGPTLFGQLIANALLDECCLTIAPMLLGSTATRLLPTALADPACWTPITLRIAGDHMFARYRCRPAP